MTKAERDECKRMVNEAKDKEAQDQSGKFIYSPGEMITRQDENHQK